MKADRLLCYNPLMSKRAAVIASILLAAFLAAYLLWPSDEARIRKLIKESSAAVEAEDVDAIMGHVSFSYMDEYGLSYMLLAQNLKRQFELYGDIEVEYENLTIEVEDQTARASMKLLVLATLGNQRGYILGDLKEPAVFDVELEKNPTGKWLVSSTRISHAEVPFR